MDTTACLTDGLPWWYVAAGGIVSAYQAARGFYFQWIKERAFHKGQEFDWGRTTFAYSLADALLYFVCSALGFVALWLAYKLTYPISREISVGASVFILFCALYGALGITGQLPYLIQNGKLPGLFRSGS